MDTPRNYIHRHISHLSTSDKLWGWFVMTEADDMLDHFGRTYHSHAWCWWCERGKTITVKRHYYNIGYLRNLEARKTKNRYVQITADELSSLWPDFSEQLDNKMVFELLRNHDDD